MLEPSPLPVGSGFRSCRVHPAAKSRWEGNGDRSQPAPQDFLPLTAPGEDKDGGMGTRTMVDVAQKATRPITEDALAGVSLLLPAPQGTQCHPGPLRGLQPMLQQRAGAGGAPGAEKDPKRVQHGGVAHLEEAGWAAGTESGR